MARTDNLADFLTDIADSIRAKKGTTEPISAGDFDIDITSIETIPKLQSKSLTITENGTQTITPDTNYDGLSDVEITTNVPSSGDIPEKGIIINSFNENGYATEITIKGLDRIISYYLGKYNSNESCGCLTSHLVKINLPSETKIINNNAFYYLTTLETMTVDNSDNPFENITQIDHDAFGYCNNLNIKALCLPKITNIQVSGNDYSIFRNNSKIEYIWVGENIKKIGKWAFAYITNLKKIFVNQPRATLESTSSNGLSYGFSNNKLKSSDIICNDEEGFLTEEQFKNMNWSTYTG